MTAPSGAPRTSAWVNVLDKLGAMVLLAVVMGGTAGFVWWAAASFGSTAGLLAVGAEVAVGAALFAVMIFGTRAAARATAASARLAATWDAPVDTGWTAAHEPLTASVAELTGLGYRSECTTSAPDGVAVVLLRHDDGSVASLNAQGRRLVLLVTTCLVPGRWWLRTVVARNSHVGESFLVDGCGRGSTPSDLVARHREVRDALHERGVATVPVAPGGAAADAWGRRQAGAADPAALQPKAGRGARTWTLLDHPALPAALDRVRLVQSAAPGP